MAFYVLDENNNRIEALDKEGVYAVLEQAIADGSLANLVADAAFVSKLRCCVTGGTNKVAFVTQAKYNELKASNQLVTNCLYYITDDTSAEDIDEQFNALNTAINSLDNKINQINEVLKTILKVEYLGTPKYGGGTGIRFEKLGLMLINLQNNLMITTYLIDLNLYGKDLAAGNTVNISAYGLSLKNLGLAAAPYVITPSDGSSVTIIDAYLFNVAAVEG